MGKIIFAALFAVHVDSHPLCLLGCYIVVCVTFYERGFGVSSHWFLRSLLQSYGLELHHLSPSGILHKMSFMTLSEALIGIECHTRFLRQNQVLIICMTRINYSTHTNQKCSQIAKCHE
jgi:hypothetical protein